MSSEPSPLVGYQTDHLILLIGSNPLPNYVAAQVLCPNGTLHLLYSTDTREVAEKLQSKLGLDRCCLKSLEDAEGNPNGVSQATLEILEHIPDGKSVGLHYTGGTKVMSVHTYRVLGESKREVIFSYLDHRTLNLVMTKQNTVENEVLFVGDKIRVSVEDLLNLHNITLSKPPKTESRLVAVCQALADIHHKKPSRIAWQTWCDANLRRAEEVRQWVSEDAQKNADHPERHTWRDIVKQGYKWKSDGKLKGVELPESSDIRAVREAFAVTFPTIESFNLEQLGAVSGFPGRENMQSFAKWLEGEWLEDYTLWKLQTLIKDGYPLHKPGMDYKAQNPEFQFDVAVTRGYQLFAFSCTTSDDIGLCKSKLFEAFTRAKQMGGDEAKTALICCHGDPAKLEQEMSREFEAKDRLKVFGAQDLLNLEVQLKTWFDSRKAKQRSH